MATPKLSITKYKTEDLNVNAPKNMLNILGGQKKMKVDAVKTAEPFSSLFPIKNDVLNAIIEDIKTNGFDDNQPIIIWKQENVLIDGHTRLKAAIELNLESVPVVYASFGSIEDVLDYMHRLQFNRRNITDSELIRLIISALPKYEKVYGQGSKADFLTKRFTGLSEGKAKQTLVVIDKASEEEIKAIENDEMSIYQTYLKLKQDKNSPKQKVSTNFFNTDDASLIRFDDSGNFFYRDVDKQKEIKVFQIHKNFNSTSLKQKLVKLFEEEFGGK